MTRIEWLTWVVRHGNPRTRHRNLRNFLLFELYSLGCLLCGYRVEHWLDRKPLPAGRYLLVSRPVPRGVKLLDKLFRADRRAHSDFVPYTPEAAARVRAAGGRVEVMDISYQLGSSE